MKNSLKVKTHIKAGDAGRPIKSNHNLKVRTHIKAGDAGRPVKSNHNHTLAR